MLPARFKSWLGSWPEWGSILLLFLVLEIVVRSIEQAQWITPQPSLTVILALAVLSGWLLSKSRLPSTATYPLAVVLGAMLTVWQASSLLPLLETASRVNQLAVALQSWWQATSVAKPSEGTIHFAVFLIFFTWIIGYISTWFIVRRQNAWVAVFLSGITILVNLSNLPERHYVFFFFYTLAALLLVGQTSLARQHYWFKKQDSTYPNQASIYFMTSLLCLSTLATSLAWLTPEIRVNRLETLITTEIPWRKNIEGRVTNFLAAVPAKQPFLKSSEQKELFFGDSFGQGDALQFIIISKQPSYWRTRMYDTYTSSGWISSQTTEQRLIPGIASTEEEGISQLSEITYTVIPKLRTDIVPTTGEFTSSNTLVSVQLLAPLSFDIDLVDPANDRSLPPDAASLARSLRAIQVANKEFRLNDLWQFLPKDLILTRIDALSYSEKEGDFILEPILDSAQPTTIELTRMPPGRTDTIAVITPLLFRHDQRYRVTASVSSAIPSDLSKVGDDYPRWVTDYYLQLPPTLPERVRQLSKTVTKEAKSSYDRALAIKQYLSQFAYTLEVKAPTQGVDGVDYFLFTQQSGNCVQFASAMTVMLRSVGVPSRFARGYTPGEWDVTIGSSALRAKDRHTWPEVYFPGYGWIGFEPTPTIEDEIEASLFGGSRGSGIDENLEELVGGGGEGGGGNIADDDLDAGGAGGTGSVNRTPRNRLGLTLFFAITSTILLVYTLWSVLSRRRQRLMRSDYASEVYGKMCSLASLVGLSPKPQQTPLEYYAKLTSVFPLQAEALDSIVQTYMERRYSSRKELGHWQRWRLRKAWREVYPVLLKCLFHIRH